jgi:signal transduction histidine kinase
LFSSLRTRLTFSHLAVIALAMSLSAFLLLSFLERYFIEAAEESLQAQARITAQALIPGALTWELGADIAAPNVELAPAFNTVQQQQLSNLALQAGNVDLPADAPSLADVDLAYLSDASLQLSTQLTTRIVILDEQGGVLVDSGLDDQEPRGVDLGADPLVARALGGEYASRIYEADGESVMQVVLPAFAADRLVGVVYLSQPLSDVTEVLRDLRTRLVLATAIALALSALVALLLSRAISSPLRRLTAAAGSVALGQFDQQVPVNSRDEVGRLSQAFNDMTARLRAARQMQVDFVADVSHELRTPLTSVKGTVETLRDGAVDDPQVRDQFLATIESETDRLIRLVNDLLLLSRVDSEALNLRREAVDLQQLIEVASDRMASQAAARAVAVKVEASSDVPEVWVDPDRTEQVLVNLLDNAIKYSRPGGTVMVSVGFEGDGMVSVQVQDNGIGIPADDLDRIGQRFYRADRARSRAEGGSGLGLAISQALVKAHGGRLWLESEEGAGTTVHFTLPAV